MLSIKNHLFLMYNFNITITLHSIHYLHRFSLDTDIIDSELPMTFEMFLDCLYIVMSTLVVISYSTPFFMIVIIPLGILYFLAQVKLTIKRKIFHPIMKLYMCINVSLMNE